MSRMPDHSAWVDSSALLFISLPRPEALRTMALHQLPATPRTTSPRQLPKSERCTPT